MCILCILAGRQLDSVNTVEMPDPASTFVLPLQFQKREDIFSELVDWDCVGYISKYLQEKMPQVIIPLRTTGSLFFLPRFSNTNPEKTNKTGWFFQKRPLFFDFDPENLGT